MSNCVSSFVTCAAIARRVLRSADVRRRVAHRGVCLTAAALLFAGTTAGAQTASGERAEQPAAANEGEAAPAQDAAKAKVAAPAQEAPPPPPPRPWPPRYAERRFDENWRPLDWANPQAGARDIFDKIKALPLNESGSAWMGFGGSVRGRLAYQSTVTFGGPFEFEPTMWTGRVRGHTDLHLGKFRAFGEYIYSVLQHRSPGRHLQRPLRQARVRRAEYGGGRPQSLRRVPDRGLRHVGSGRVGWTP